jgi:hypothetical protein
MDAYLVLALDLDTSPFNQLSPRAYITLMGIGFVVGTFGHIIRSKPLIAAGVTMIFLATVLLPLTAHVSR